LVALIIILQLSSNALSTHPVSVVKYGFPVHHVQITIFQSFKYSKALILEYFSTKFIPFGSITTDFSQAFSKKFFNTTQLKTVDNILKL